ncbi:Nuclear elongation and deformation protein 1 [Wickerhamomyces ciferrii]|uniref:Nuclear elongation and deformation protein 1 n=1 Tax=Wickerhamomyces ciferrii (strain ATCC 14091 / BCRC 22168 / CBS 111 / JCM 3599 / NBRC 0793 / NRRL Y-1031 F-60-10) TaxID=1206466 RepID=K0KLY0_WICCF|nr:Nuclear elongation and deformation protein 1 [Wickerhamomyces ciferrii]CCH43212.1 Nuclear elongation and deformation protein 1 [Wickerhamomyces ciferrii]
MQYVGRAFDSVSKTWSSINPSTLSGAIDVVVVENELGELNCSPFHVRFGKFQLLRPSQKKVDFIINGKLTNLPMKLGDGGEAFFVFETSKNVDVPNDMITSPVLSAISSPDSSPPSSPRKQSNSNVNDGNLQEPEFLDISMSQPDLTQTKPKPVPIPISNSDPELSTKPQQQQHLSSSSPKDLTLEKFQKLSKKLTMINIPTKIDKNGDLFLDMNGYKSNEQNIHDTDDIINKILTEEFGNDIDVSQLVKEDEMGNIKIFSSDDLSLSSPPLTSTSDSLELSSMISASTGGVDETTTDSQDSSQTNYVKTLRLTSEQLKFLDLKPGENDLCFSVDKGKALITSKLYLWKSNVPIVISDIDGTITKSDALGHVLTMLGRDWTHPGVAKLFTDIKLNGYNIMYLTARGVGQAEMTRTYLRNIEQDGDTLPYGPVLLSPDRTMAALKREVILKKPEVFKMACLSDIMYLFGEVKNPFYAGFGNRITDALSYRSVNIPSSRIFTINPVGEVHMELLELAGYKSSYVYINELVDHFFPPVESSDINDEHFTDVNYWRESLPDLSDLSDEELNSSNKNEFNEYRPNSKNQIDFDKINENYNENEDDDYEDEGSGSGSGSDDDEEEDYDDDDIDEDNNEFEDEYDSDLSNEESFQDDIDEEDLDQDLIQQHYHQHPGLNQSGILPMTSERSGITLNQNHINGININSSNNFIKASELMNKLSINDLKKKDNEKK